MKPVCLGPDKERGCDVSKWQGHFDWAVRKKAGMQFGFCKATDVYHGELFVDQQFQSNWTQLKLNGLIRGAYHFMHPSIDPDKQAQFFVKTLGPLGPGDIIALDWETTDGEPSQTDSLHAMTWLTSVEQLTGKMPIIYTGPYFANALKLGAGFAKYPLWVAHYGAQCPLIPQPWGGPTFWQYSNSGGVLDMDYFNGTLDQLKALAGS